MTKFIFFLTTFLFLHFKVLALETKGVITTIQPINSLVSAVIGNTGKTTSLIPAEISPHEFKALIGDDIKLEPVIIKDNVSTDELLSYYMGKNTQSRQDFIIQNLKNEELVIS